jgi:hypothetical protein
LPEKEFNFRNRRKKVKKIMMFLAVTMLLLGVSGQAMAFFENGDLFRVVYFNGTGGTGTGTEYVTDLGSIASFTSPSSANLSLNTSNFSLSNLGTGANWANSYVAYFAVAPDLSTAWVSGNQGGQMNNGSAFGAGFLNGYFQLQGQAQLVGGQSVQIAQSNGASYYTGMNINGSGVGVMGGFLNGGGDANLAALATTGGHVDQMLYFYSDPQNNHSGTPVTAMNLRTFADGHTEFNAGSVPIPPSVLLLGSGLLGLVGIGRKRTV